MTTTHAYGDLFYSLVHNRLVRFLGWFDSTHARVLDRDTLRELPDIVHREQLLTPAQAYARRGRQ